MNKRSLNRILASVLLAAIAILITQKVLAEDATIEKQGASPSTLSGSVITIDPETGERIHDPDAAQRLIEQAGRTMERFHRRMDEIRFIELEDGTVVMDSAQSFINFSAARVNQDGQVRQACLSTLTGLRSFVASNQPHAGGADHAE